MGCLVSSQSNQRPTMNKFIILAAVAILVQFAGNNASAVVLNEGIDCWIDCEQQQGPCEWCGSGVCCRKGWWDTSNGCDGTIGMAGKGHVCVGASAPTTGEPVEASESNKDWCCKVVLVHGNVPGKFWGRLDARHGGDEGLRKEWDNKGCNALVANGGDGHNTNNCSGNFNNNKDWCCAASDLYKGKEKGGFNTIDLSTKTSNHPVKLWWDKKRCWEHNSNCSA